MGKTENEDGFGLVDCGGIQVWVAPDIWQRIGPATEKMLIAIEGYGRFWLYLADEQIELMEEDANAAD